jgi:hypothetical protein
VPPQQEPHTDSPQEEEPFEIVVTVPAGEDSQETQPKPQNHDQQEEEDNEKEEDDNKAEGEKDEDYTPWSNVEKDEIFHNADEIKTFGDETPIPTGKLRDLFKHINITTPPEFRIKRIPRPGREEYKAIVEIISGPNVLSRHKGPAFRITYPNAVADAAWQAITTYYTKEKDRMSVAQNSGICIEAFDPLGVKTTYYGYIQDIWELDYDARLQIPIFKYQ